MIRTFLLILLLFPQTPTQQAARPTEPTDPMPVNQPGTRTVLEHYRKVRRLVANQTVLMPTTFEFPGLIAPESEPLVLAGHIGVPPQRYNECEVRFLDWPKPQLSIHGASLTDLLRVLARTETLVHAALATSRPEE